MESIPQVLRDNLSKADAETMKAKIEAAGGVCVVEWEYLPNRLLSTSLIRYILLVFLLLLSCSLVFV